MKQNFCDDDVNIESDDKKNMPIIAKLMNVVIS